MTSDIKNIVELAVYAVGYAMVIAYVLYMIRNPNLCLKLIGALFHV